MFTISWRSSLWLGLLMLSPAHIPARIPARIPAPLAAHLTAQGPAPRHLVIGQIEDEDGEWKSAEILFYSQPRLEGIESADQALGRKRGKHGILARLQAGREYRVVARWEREGQPTLWTRIEKLPADKTSFVLKPRRFAPSRPKIRLTGQDAWKQVSPLEFRLVDALGQSRKLSESLDKEGRLPSLPGPYCWIEVREPGGRRLHLYPIPLKKQGTPSTLDLAIPPPIQVRVHVTDADSGEPIEGARVFDGHSRNEDIRFGGFTTDKGGRVTLTVARPTTADGGLDQKQPLLFRIRAAQHKLACAGWNSKHLGAESEIPGPNGDGSLDLEVRMQPAKNLKGSLREFPTSIRDKLRLFVQVQTMMPAPEGLGTWTRMPWHEVRIRKDGTYVIPRPSEGKCYLRQGLYFSDGLCTQWSKLHTEGQPLGRSERILPLPPVNIAKGTDDAALPPIDNKLVHLLDLRVQLADGHRGRDLPIHILYPDTETSTRDRTRLLGKIDGKGRFRRLFYGVVPALYLRGPKSYALLEDEARATLRARYPDKATVIQLETMPTIRGEVSMVDGSPAAKARVRLKPYRLDPTQLTGGVDSRFFKALTSIALFSETLVAKDGTFEIAFLPFPPRKLLLDASWRSEDGTFHHVMRAIDWGDRRPVTLTFPR